MKISSQYRSQYSFRHESNINNTRINENMVKKNEIVGKDTYLSNIMKQKQELNDRIRDLKDRQEIYTKKINEAIKNLYKSEIRETTNNFSNIETDIKDNSIEDKNKLLKSIIKKAYYLKTATGGRWNKEAQDNFSIELELNL